MTKKKILLPTIFTIMLLFSASTALAIHKCTSNEGTTYTDLPCPNGANSTPFTAQIVPPNDPKEAKRRYSADQKALNKINQQKAKDEIQQKREAQSLARQMKQIDEREFKCRELGFKRKLAQQHLTEVQIKRNSKSTHKAQIQLTQATDKYTHYCNSAH